MYSLHWNNTRLICANPKTYYNIPSFYKLFTGLEENEINKVDEVSQEVKAYPEWDSLWCMVREAKASSYEPGVIVEGQGHNTEPRNVPTI